MIGTPASLLARTAQPSKRSRRAARGSRTALLRAAVLVLAALTGCARTLAHPDVRNPIVLGDRLHVGNDSERARFDHSEVFAKYEVQSSSTNAVASSPSASASGWERKNDAVAVARSMLHVNGRRAVVKAKPEGSAVAMFLGFAAGEMTSVRVTGLVIDIEPHPSEAAPKADPEADEASAPPADAATEAP